jgi:hypothetical protein
MRLPNELLITIGLTTSFQEFMHVYTVAMHS